MSQNSQKSRKIRALAAGGAVLGLGAAITLASWSDSEFAQGLFSADDFGIQAATDGAEYGDHVDAGSALNLNFGGAAGSLYPGQTIAQAYQIKNIAGGANSVVTFLEETSQGELPITAVIRQVNSVECAPDTEGNILEEGGTFNLIGEDPEYLCVQVTLDSGFSENVSELENNIVWEFEAAHLEPA